MGSGYFARVCVPSQFERGRLSRDHSATCRYLLKAPNTSAVIRYLLKAPNTTQLSRESTLCLDTSLCYTESLFPFSHRSSNPVTARYTPTCGVCVALNLRSGEDRLRLLVRLESGKPEDLPCGRFLVGIPPLTFAKGLLVALLSGTHHWCLP